VSVNQSLRSMVTFFEAIIVSMAVSVNQFLRSMVIILKKSGYLGHVFQRYTGPCSDLIAQCFCVGVALKGQHCFGRQCAVFLCFGMCYSTSFCRKPF
jgi:hypothetical protein